MKTIVYVDGFNLYYGAVKGTAHKWLDISKLCTYLLPKNQVITFKYFTATVKGRPTDPDQPARQQLYLRALRTIPNLEIIRGHFLSHPVWMRLANPPPIGHKFAEVIRTEEKGSDVNIAAHMVNDAHRARFEIAILISNDSDLLEPIRIVRKDVGLPVGVLNPIPDQPSMELQRWATFVKPIRSGVLAASQFPSPLTDRAGTFHKPPSW